MIPSENSPVLDPIQLGLPHREPFLFVDCVVALEPGKSARAQRIFAGNDPVFAGHFPGNPLVPGVLLTEALAQTAGLALGRKTDLRLAAIRSMKFPAAAFPDETIALEAQCNSPIQNDTGLWHFTVIARVDDRIVAEGSLVLAEMAGAHSNSGVG